MANRSTVSISGRPGNTADAGGNGYRSGGLHLHDESPLVFRILVRRPSHVHVGQCRWRAGHPSGIWSGSETVRRSCRRMAVEVGSHCCRLLLLAVSGCWAIGLPGGCQFRQLCWLLVLMIRYHILLHVFLNFCIVKFFFVVANFIVILTRPTQREKK